MYKISNTKLKKTTKTRKKALSLSSYKEHLKDLIKTPLYIYRYIDIRENNFPRKIRMGVISKDSLNDLQLKRKDKYFFPNWPSIYGTFWPSSKTLYKKIVQIKKLFKQLQSDFQNILSQIIQLQNNFKLLKEQFFFLRDYQLKNFNRTVKAFKESLEFSITYQNKLLNHSFKKLNETLNETYRAALKYDLEQRCVEGGGDA